MQTFDISTAKITFTSLYKVKKQGVEGRYFDVQFDNGISIKLVFATGEHEAKEEAKQMLTNFMSLTSLENRINSVAHRTNAFSFNVVNFD